MTPRRLESWPDEYRKPVDVSGSDAYVAFDFGAPRVRQQDDTLTPPEFTYVEAPRGDSPRYEVDCFHDASGLPRIGAVHVLRTATGREVRSSDLRRLRNLEDVIQSAWRAASYNPLVTIADSREEADAVFAARVSAQPEALKRQVRGLRQQARRSITPEVIEETARVYRAGRATGAPTKAVADHFGLAPSTASLYVKRARAAGMDMDGDRG